MYVCTSCRKHVDRLTSTADGLCSRCYSRLYPEADRLWREDQRRGLLEVTGLGRISTQSARLGGKGSAS